MEREREREMRKKKKSSSSCSKCYVILVRRGKQRLVPEALLLLLLPLSATCIALAGVEVLWGHAGDDARAGKLKKKNLI